MTPTFLIATPAFNSAAFIDETMQSIIFQAGDFRIRYHVQDGGSRDQTLAKLERWSDLLAAGTLPLICAGVDFTFASEKDAGMYDAINRGFDRLAPAAGQAMAVHDLHQFRRPPAPRRTAIRRHHLRRLARNRLARRPPLRDERARRTHAHSRRAGLSPRLPAGRPARRPLAPLRHAGGHLLAHRTVAKGRRLPHRPCARPAIGISGAASLRKPAYVTTDMVLAAHRRREAQLTADMTTYYREVDETIASEIGDLHPAELQRYREWAASSEADRDQRFYGPILRFHVATLHAGSGAMAGRNAPLPGPAQDQRRGHQRLHPADAPRRIRRPASDRPATPSIRSTCCPATMSPPPPNARSVSTRSAKGCTASSCAAASSTPESGSNLPMPRAPSCAPTLPVTSHDRDCTVIAESVFAAGPNQIRMTITGEDPGKLPIHRGDRRRGHVHSVNGKLHFGPRACRSAAGASREPTGASRQFNRAGRQVHRRIAWAKPQPCRTIPPAHCGSPTRPSRESSQRISGGRPAQRAG